MGCTFYEMIMQKDLFFAGNSEIDHLNDIFRIRGTPDDTLLSKLSGSSNTLNLNNINIYHYHH